MPRPESDGLAAARLAAIVESAGDAIFAKSTDGLVTDWNVAATRLYGYAARDIIGRHIDGLIAPESRAETRELLQRAASGALVQGHETTHLTRDGHRLPVAVTISPVRGSDGSVSGLSVIARDLTARRAAERETRAAQEEADRWRTELDRTRRLNAIGELTAGIAHNFNNLLGIIITSVALIERELDQHPEFKEDLGLLRTATERAAQLTSQLLAVGGRAEPAPMVVDLGRTFSELDGLIAHSLGREITVSVTHRDALWPVLVDPSHLTQVVLSLTSNARDAMPDGGHLAVRTRNVQLTVDDGDPNLIPGRYVELTIADTGTGMPPELAARAFEPFMTTKEPGRGTGLGLPTAYGLVRRAGGSIRLESVVGKGTTVRVLWRAASHGDP